MITEIEIVLFTIFFFQAEDGIRDRDVTGVQTCALPISLDPFNGARPFLCIFADTLVGFADRAAFG